MNKEALLIWRGKDYGQGPYRLFERVLTEDDLRFLQIQINNILLNKEERGLDL